LTACSTIRKLAPWCAYARLLSCVDDPAASRFLGFPAGDAEQQNVASPTSESETAVYAIVRSGGTQQKVAVGDVIEIDKVSSQAGESVTLPVLLLVDGDRVTSDAGALAGASVTAEVVGDTKGPKITILKFKNKTGYRKRQGHRQKYTQVKVTEITV
jgi:large subunit ribosomal protein L21